MARYKMVARDVNSSPTQYRTWIVNDTPDFDGYYYTGLKSGPEPFIDVSAYKIPDGAIMDFNLSTPQKWHRSWRVMPAAVYSSQLAVIDGYIYLFGGQESSKIYRAPTNNPADWLDTGATLPTKLGGASYVDPNDGYIYLIGGLVDEAVDTIYCAPKTNPLAWTNLGHKLPQPLQKSSLIVADGYIYLLGGEGLNHGLDNIFRASVTSPTVWTDTGAVLPDRLYGSIPAIIGTTMYLFGGLLNADTPSKTIYAASLTTPTTWQVVGELPYSGCYGQFVTIGTHGYLFTCANLSESATPSGYFTRIFRCDLSSPNLWIDTLALLPGELSQSQMAVIYDRVFLFGGNGNTIVLACDQKLKYLPTNTQSVAYGNTTRTLYQAATVLDKFKVLGYPAWKTNY